MVKMYVMVSVYIMVLFSMSHWCTMVKGLFHSTGYTT